MPCYNGMWLTFRGKTIAWWSLVWMVMEYVIYMYCRGQRLIVVVLSRLCFGRYLWVI